VRDTWQITPALSWQQFLAVNPEPTVIPTNAGPGWGNPASGCSYDAVVGVPTGWANFYVARYVRSFFTCISLYDSPYSWANYSIVTQETFSNKSSRDAICNGKEGMCTSAFCDQLYTNFTQYTPSFCSSLDGSLSEAKRCMRDFRISAPSLWTTSESNFVKLAVKTTTVRSVDYDYLYGLRYSCLSSAYSDNSAALLTNTAVFAKCPILPESVTEGAKFKINFGASPAFANSLGWSDRGGKACLATYSAGSALSLGTVTLFAAAMVTIITSTTVA